MHGTPLREERLPLPSPVNKGCAVAADQAVIQAAAGWCQPPLQTFLTDRHLFPGMVQVL